MNSQTEQSYRERMLRVLVHIQEHLDEALTLDELARVAHFSPYHFHRIFVGMVGETVMAHIRRLRLERAALRLKASDQPVTHIAFEAGYETHEAFTRAFRAMFGQSPSGSRELHQPLPLPPVASGVHYRPAGGPETFEPVSGETPMEASIKRLDEIRVVFMRHTGPYNQVGPTWMKLMGWAGPRGLLGPNMKCLGLSHDDPEVTPPDRLRYDACLVVGPGVEAAGDVGVQTIAGGDYAMTVHHGPYENLAQTYAALCGQWLPQQGRELRSAPCIEIYLNNPQTTTPEQLRTEVYVPLEAR